MSIFLMLFSFVQIAFHRQARNSSGKQQGVRHTRAGDHANHDPAVLDNTGVQKSIKTGKKSKLTEVDQTTSRIERQIQESFGATNVKACKSFERSIEIFDEACKQTSNLVVYNPIAQVRYLCGKEIRTEKPERLSHPCMEGSRVFPKDPPLHPSPDFEPRMGVIAGIKEGNPQKFDCNIPCDQWGNNLGSISIDNSNWRFTYSMEGSGYYPDLRVDEEAWKYNQFYATTSFKSDVPLPYFSWAEYSIQKPGVDFKKVIKGASFIARNCGSTNDRETLVRNLTRIFRVDSLSSCLHNADPPNGSSMSNKIDVQRNYLFHLAFENTCENDYITEKLWGTLESGTVPVYYGAPNVKDHAPENSIISWHDFNDTIKLGEYLIKVASNQQLYESYHAWRYKPLADVFVNKYNFTHTHSICRLCRWGYARRYGFGWNTTTQNVQDTRISRKVYTDSQGLLIHPINERWMQGGNTIMETKGENVASGKIETLLQIGNGSRSLWIHDGVLDMIVDEWPGEGFEMEVCTPIKTNLQEKAPNHFVFQNNYSRYTIVTRQTVPAQSVNPGVISFSNFQAGFALRVIVEDLDTFHQGATEQISYFAENMISDFMNPLQFFLVSDPSK